MDIEVGSMAKDGSEAGESVAKGHNVLFSILLLQASLVFLKQLPDLSYIDACEHFKSRWENDYENVIAGGDAEKENVIKVFKDNGLENCLGGDATDAEEVFTICRNTRRIADVYVAGGPNARLNFLKLQQRLLLSSIQAFRRATPARMDPVFTTGLRSLQLNSKKPDTEGC
ncbi:hypothetical protein WN943_000916 [Citrus x changshan-huyou]